MTVALRLALSELDDAAVALSRPCIPALGVALVAAAFTRTCTAPGRSCSQGCSHREARRSCSRWSSRSRSIADVGDGRLRAARRGRDRAGRSRRAAPAAAPGRRRRDRRRRHPARRASATGPGTSGASDWCTPRRGGALRHPRQPRACAAHPHDAPGPRPRRRSSPARSLRAGLDARRRRRRGELRGFAPAGLLLRALLRLPVRGVLPRGASASSRRSSRRSPSGAWGWRRS